MQYFSSVGHIEQHGYSCSWTRLNFPVNANIFYTKIVLNIKLWLTDSGYLKAKYIDNDLLIKFQFHLFNYLYFQSTDYTGVGLLQCRIQILLYILNKLTLSTNDGCHM